MIQYLNIFNLKSESKHSYFTILIVNPKNFDFFAFYPSTALPSRLGSVAIYTTEISSVLSGIRMTKSLFGFKVAKAKIEQGRRPFIDVTIIP